LKNEIENNNNFYKGIKKKIRNQNNEDQVEKHNTINLNWEIKLKTNKTFTKESRKKLEIRIIKTSEVEILTIKRAKLWFLGRKEKREKKLTSDKPNHQSWNTLVHKEEDMGALSTTRNKRTFLYVERHWHYNNKKTIVKKQKYPLRPAFFFFNF
jgi:hypothetical protein